MILEIEINCPYCNYLNVKSCEFNLFNSEKYIEACDNCWKDFVTESDLSVQTKTYKIQEHIKDEKYKVIVDFCESHKISQRIIRNEIKKLEIEIKKTKRPSTKQIVDVISSSDAEKVLDAIKNTPVLGDGDVTLAEASNKLGISKNSVRKMCNRNSFGMIKKFPLDYPDVKKRWQDIFVLNIHELNELKKDINDFDALDIFS